MPSPFRSPLATEGGVSPVSNERAAANKGSAIAREPIVVAAEAANRAARKSPGDENQPGPPRPLSAKPCVDMSDLRAGVLIRGGGATHQSGWPAGSSGERLSY